MTAPSAISEALLAGERLTSTDAWKRLGCKNIDKEIKRLRTAGWKIKKRRIGDAASPSEEFWMEDAARERQVEKDRIAAGEKHWGGDLKRLFHGANATVVKKRSGCIVLYNESRNAYFLNLCPSKNGEVNPRWTRKRDAGRSFSSYVVANKFKRQHNIVGARPVQL